MVREEQMSETHPLTTVSREEAPVRPGADILLERAPDLRVLKPDAMHLLGDWVLNLQQQPCAITTCWDACCALCGASACSQITGARQQQGTSTGCRRSTTFSKPSDRK